MKKQYILLCVFMLLVCAWIVKSCGNCTEQKQPQQAHPNSTNNVHNLETVTQAETSVAVAERSIFPPQWKLSREVEHAMTKGARARATLRVVDSTGKGVPNARVRLNFMFFGRKGNFETGLTDTNGLFSGEKDTMSECNWFIEKEGYYNTEGRHSFAANLTNDSVKNGRWQPWNPILEVVLKEKRKPIPMLITWETKVVVPKGKTVGFDCKIRSLVAPYGSGEISDFIMTYSSNGKDRLNLEKRIRIKFPDDCGFIKLPKDTFSQFPSLHEAPEDDYKQEFAFEFARTPSTILKDEGLQDSEYFIMRSRVKKDDDGKIVSAMYGKMYRFAFDESDDGKTGYLLLHFYVNPTPNDRNLEAEGRYP